MAIEEIGDNTAVSSGVNVPPPPAEVKVRTMKSDFEALAKSGGGGSPQFRTVAVEGLSLSKTQAGGNLPKGEKSTSFNREVWGIILLALAVLAVIVWFGYTAFVRK